MNDDDKPPTRVEVVFTFGLLAIIAVTLAVVCINAWNAQ